MKCKLSVNKLCVLEQVIMKAVTALTLSAFSTTSLMSPTM